MSSFKERLKDLRTERGMTQDQLADALDIPAPTIRRLESSETDSIPRKERLSLISDYFNVSIDYLLGKTDIRYDLESNSNMPQMDEARKELIDMIKKTPEEDLADLKLLVKRFVKDQ